MTTICILGAGISGLTQGYALHKNKINFDIIESSNTPGGVIQSYQKDGFLAELGPHTIQGTPTVQHLIQELNLTQEVVTPPPHSNNRFIYKNNHLHPLPHSPLALLKSPLLSLQGKLRLLSELCLPTTSLENISIGTYIQKRFGQETVDYCLDPFISGIYASSPYSLSLQYAFPKLFQLASKNRSLLLGFIKNKPKPPPIISFRNGMHTLPEKLASILKNHIHYQATVTLIQYLGPNQWEITFTSLSKKITKKYTDIYITIAPHQSTKLSFHPQNISLLEAIQSIPSIPYAPVGCMTLGLPTESIGHRLNGFGFLVPSKQNLPILGTLFTASIFPNRAPKGYTTLATFIGQKDITPELAKELTLSSLKKALNIRYTPPIAFIKYQFWPQAIPQYTLEYPHFLNSLEAIEKRFPGLHFTGNYRTSVSLPAILEKNLTI